MDVLIAGSLDALIAAGAKVSKIPIAGTALRFGTRCYNLYYAGGPVRC
jgi:hypothetical protein|eukprot:COSAG01_NODE_7263_length_3277_cov_6.894588_2_plen_48_part_00